jgi:hypothetical protein
MENKAKDSAKNAIVALITVTLASAYSMALPS